MHGTCHEPATQQPQPPHHVESTTTAYAVTPHVCRCGRAIWVDDGSATSGKEKRMCRVQGIRTKCFLHRPASLWVVKALCLLSRRLQHLLETLQQWLHVSLVVCSVALVPGTVLLSNSCCCCARHICIMHDACRASLQ
jgi:hypothetical protein